MPLQRSHAAGLELVARAPRRASRPHDVPVVPARIPLVFALCTSGLRAVYQSSTRRSAAGIVVLRASMRLVLKLARVRRTPRWWDIELEIAPSARGHRVPVVHERHRPRLGSVHPIRTRARGLLECARTRHLDVHELAAWSQQEHRSVASYRAWMALQPCRAGAHRRGGRASIMHRYCTPSTILSLPRRGDR